MTQKIRINLAEISVPNPNITENLSTPHTENPCKSVRPVKSVLNQALLSLSQHSKHFITLFNCFS